jgi:hypothetical protein
MHCQSSGVNYTGRKIHMAQNDSGGLSYTEAFEILDAHSSPSGYCHSPEAFQADVDAAVQAQQWTHADQQTDAHGRAR